jgi:very-short-patch-repair endonuclease
LAVEPGAARWHAGALQQRRDHARDRGCSELGWHVVRFAESLRDDPMAAARQVLRIYTARHRQKF